MLKCKRIVRQNGEIQSKEIKETSKYFDDIMETKLEKIATKIKELKIITNNEVYDEILYDVNSDIKTFKNGFPIDRQIHIDDYVFDYRINPIKLRGHIHKKTPDGRSSTRDYF